MVENLKEKFRREGFDKQYIADKLLPSIGIYSIRPEEITYQFHPLERGIGLDSRVYRVDVYTSKGREDPRASASFIIKDYIPAKDAEFAFHDDPAELDRRDRDVSELKYLKAFGRDLVVEYDRRHRRLILNAWDDSLDQYLIECTENHDPQLFAPIDEHSALPLSTPYQVTEALWNTRFSNVRDIFAQMWLKSSASNIDLYKQGVHPPVVYDPKRYKRKLMHHIDDLVRWFERPPYTRASARSYFHTHRSAIEKEFDPLLAFLSDEQAVIHADGRTENILYRKTSTDMEFSLCDFASVHVGPVAIDLATFLHDYYITHLGVDTDRKKVLFTESMLNFAVRPLWEKSPQVTKNVDTYLSSAYSLASCFVLLKDLGGLRSRLENRHSEKYTSFVEKHPHEINSAVIPERVQQLQCALSSTSFFPHLRRLLDQLQPHGKHSWFHSFMNMVRHARKRGLL